MRSFGVISGENALAQQFTNLRADARGGSFLLAQQMLGYFSMGTNPANGKTWTLTINGTAVSGAFVSAIGSTAGNVLIGATAAATVANWLALLDQPQTTTSTGVALSAANQTLVSYLSFAAPSGGTTLYVLDNNTALYAPRTSFSASTNATSDSFTSQTMQLYVHSGTVYVDGTRVLFTGGSTPTVTAPASNPRIDVLTVDNTGTLAWTTGTESATPAAPTYPGNKVAICELYNVTSETVLVDFDNQASGKGYIYNDVRPFLGERMNWTAFPSNIIPDADGTRDLGSGTHEWGSIYAKNGIFLNGTAVNTVMQTTLPAGEALTAGQPIIPLFVPANNVAVDAAISGTMTSTHTDNSLNIGAHSNQGLLVLIAAEGSTTPTVTGVTWNGVSMTQIAATGSPTRGHVYAYYLKSPAQGSQSLVITQSGAGTMDYYAYSLYNVDTSTNPVANTTADSASSIALSTTDNFSTVFCCATASSSFGGAFNANVLNATAGTQAGQSGVQTFPTIETFTFASGSDAVAVAIQPYTATATLQAFKAGSASTGQSSAFMGFASSSYSQGATATITVGGIDINQSGLTAGVQYYLNDTRGTIGTSPGTVTRKVGIAMSSTSILVTNIW